MTKLTHEQLASMPIETLISHHRVLDLELQDLREYKVLVHAAIERLQPVIASQPGAHMIGGKVSGK